MTLLHIMGRFFTHIMYSYIVRMSFERHYNKPSSPKDVFIKKKNSTRNRPKTPLPLTRMPTKP